MYFAFWKVKSYCATSHFMVFSGLRISKCGFENKNKDLFLTINNKLCYSYEIILFYSSDHSISGPTQQTYLSGRKMDKKITKRQACHNFVSEYENFHDTFPRSQFLECSSASSIETFQPVSIASNN